MCGSLRSGTCFDASVVLTTKYIMFGVFVKSARVDSSCTARKIPKALMTQMRVNALMTQMRVNASTHGTGRLVGRQNDSSCVMVRTLLHICVHASQLVN